MGAKKRMPALGSEPQPADALELPERWNPSREAGLVLQVLRSEALDAVSRES